MPRMRFPRFAELEIIGVTPRGRGHKVCTEAIASLGLGFITDVPLHNGAGAILVIPAPDGTIVRATGHILRARPIADGSYAAAIEFDQEQPLLSAGRLGAC